jgi:ribonuclease P protein subunit RPR2
MGKGKHTKATVGATNKHLYSRISYLYQAASYLSTQHIHQKAAQSPDAHPSTNLTQGDCPNSAFTPEAGSTKQGEASTSGPPTISQDSKHNKPDPPPTLNLPLSRHLLSNLRTISHKGQIRLSPSIKRSICKKCASLLIPGSSSTHRVDNRSRGGKKPWADVLVIRCNACGTEKRFPVGAGMNPKSKQRGKGEGPVGVEEDNVRGADYVLWSERPDVAVDPKIENTASGTQ